jgi:hypothetical protein
VRMELLKEIKPWLEQHYEVVSDRADLYAYFFELGHKLLKPGGRLGYISSSTFFKTGSGEPLRRYLAEQATLEKIVDFGDLQVFEGVTTYPAITVMRKTFPRMETSLAILTLRESIPANLDQYFAQEHGTMLQSRLGEQSWQLEDENLSQLRQKLVQGYSTLKEVYGFPVYGIKTGLNEAFVIDSQTRDRLIEEDPRSNELLKPFLEGKDLKRWHAQPRGLWIIYIPKGRININDYPAIKNRLQPYRDKLERRATKQEWFELQQPQVAYYDDFLNRKIFYPEFSDRPKFHSDRRGLFSNNKCFSIPTSDNYLLGLLNSKTIWFYLSGICTFVRGGFYELRTIKVETIPVPEVSVEKKNIIGNLAEKCQELSEQRYSIENNFRRRLPDLCPPEREAKLNNKLKSWWLLDFADLQKQIKSLFKSTIPLAERNDWQDYFEAEKAKITTLNQQIAQHETELNQEVYRLFNLTPQEILLVEA